MALVANRRSVMTLFSDAVCPYSHRTRIVLAEKSITVEVVNIDPDNKPEDLIDLNPYQTVPTLVDRELVLYGSRVIMEYLDDRYPQPPLLPGDPVSRARTRLFFYRIERDWYGLIDALMGADEKQRNDARRILRDGLAVIAPIFQEKPFFMSDEFSMVDCSLAVLLWRLPWYGVDIPAQARPLVQYMDRVFSRESFRKSLTPQEKGVVLKKF